MSQCNIEIVGELKNKYHKTPNSITTDWRISDGAQRLYQLLLLLEFKQKYITYEFLSSIIKKPNGKNLSVVTIKRLSKELQKAGWLEVQTHKVHINGKAQTVARYAVHVENASAPMSYNEQQQKLAEEQMWASMDGLQTCLDDDFDGLEQELQAQGIEVPAAKVHADKYLVERIAEANSVYGSVVGRLQYWADMFVEKTGRQLNEDELARMAKKLAADSTTDFNKTIELELLASGRR